MLNRCISAVSLLLVVALPGFAQVPWQFQWRQGDVLTYKIKHVTSVVEIVDNTKNTSNSQLDIIDRWDVTEIDAKGIATLSRKLTAMRNEQKRPNGETLLFDSQNLEKSTPELREQMSKFIGQTLAVIRVDGYGRIIQVKQGSAAGFEAEPPFLVVLPAAKAAAGQAWRRSYNLVLDPPFGTGEKYQLEQRYDCKKIEGGKATLAVTTEFKTMPDNLRERLPLLQKDVQGEIVFDLPAGRLVSARLNIDKTVENHQGKGSSYQFKSEYTRQLID